MDDKIVPFGGDREPVSWGTLYRVMFNLELAGSSFRKPGAEALVIWLYADSGKSAIDKAGEIVKQLPYCIANPWPIALADYPVPVKDDSHLPGQLNDKMMNCERAARKF